MQKRPAMQRPRRQQRLMSLLMASLVSSLLGAMGHAQERLGPCASGFVQEWPHQPQGTLATYRPVDAPGEVVQLGWLGHSSFLLTSPMGLRLLTDPNPLYPLPVAPEVVTISNLHDTHTGISSIPGQPQLLWGLTPEGAWNQIATTMRDMALFNVPSYASRIEPEQSPVQNSIFIFRMGRLCIAHLGNLRHPLTPRQLQHIGKPDVIMVPADGQWTLSSADVVTVIEQLQPRLVLPMHIDVPFQAEMFARFTGGRYPVRRVPERHLTLSPSLLPTATEIVLLGSP